MEKYNYKGQEYSLYSLATVIEEDTGLKACTFVYRMKHCDYDIDKALHFDSKSNHTVEKPKIYDIPQKQYLYYGYPKTFDELKTLAGCSKNEMLKRLRHYSPEDSVGFGCRMHHCDEKYYYNGDRFTVKELAYITGCDMKYLRDALVCHDVEDAIKMAQINAEEKFNNENETFMYEGKLFTVKELADYAKIDVRTMSTLLDTYPTIDKCMKQAQIIRGKVYD